jgi:carboxymethylenebutenolidase
MCDEETGRPAPPGQSRGPGERLAPEEFDLLGPDGSRGIIRYPATARSPAPLVIVCPERYGVVQHTIEVTEAFADAGYVAVAPDFFFDQDDLPGGDIPQIADSRISDVVARIARHAGADERCDGTRIAVFGVCRSGSWGLVAAAALPQVCAVLVVYGGAGDRESGPSALRPRPLADIVAASQVPAYGTFGELDHVVSVQDVLRLRALFESCRRGYDFRIEAGLPHGWLNRTMPGRWRPQAAARTWAEIRDYLHGRFAAGASAGQDVSWRFASRISRAYDFSTNRRLE